MTVDHATFHFEIAADVPRRVLRVRLSGYFEEQQMQAVARAYAQAVDRFHGVRHVVLADMRGMKTLRPEVAGILGATIKLGRERGAVLCAHLSDHSVQRLQAHRLARENSPADDVTVDVGSLAEAEQVVEEARARLDDPGLKHSVRVAVAGG